MAAAFGRLCVETPAMLLYAHSKGAAAFGRLCVETLINDRAKVGRGQPPSGGCVLKPK